MNRGLKIGGGILLAAAATGGIIWWFRKSYKKELSAIEASEKRIADELKEIGVSKDNLDNTMINEEEDNGTPLAKAIYSCLRYNSEVDMDTIDIDQCLNCGDTLIHVSEVTNGNKRYLDFLFEIPNYVIKSYKAPRIGDYIRAFNDAAAHINDEFVKYQKPHTKLEGLFMFSYLNPDYDPEIEDSSEYISKTLKLDSDLYGDYADDRHDGLTKFYEEVQLACDDNEKGQLPSDLAEIFVNWICEKTDLNLEDVRLDRGFVFNLVYRVSFPIADADQHQFGINLMSAVKSIKWLVENLVVLRDESSGKEVRYEHVMVNTLNDDGEPDWSYYFEEKDGKIIVDYCN